MSSPLRIAAVGLEHDEIYRVLDRLRRHESAALVAIAERSGRLRMAAAGRYRTPVFPRLTRLLAAVACDAVLVATTNGDKAAIIVEAMQAGKHVIAHAPLAVSPAQLDSVAAAQAAAGVGVLLLLPLRYAPAYAALHTAVARGQLGELGQVLIVNSQRIAATPRTHAFYDSPTHGGVLTTLAVDDLDVLRRLGGELTLASAVTRCHGLTDHADFEESGLMHFAFASGGAAVVACNWLAPESGAAFHELTAIGDAGSAWISGGKATAFGGAGDFSALAADGGHAYAATRDQPGHVLSSGSDRSAVDVDAAMVDAALLTLADPDLRRAATADALTTSRLAVTAQHMARHNGAKRDGAA